MCVCVCVCVCVCARARARACLRGPLVSENALHSECYRCEKRAFVVCFVLFVVVVWGVFVCLCV